MSQWGRALEQPLPLQAPGTGHYLAAEVDTDKTCDPVRHKLRGQMDDVYHLVVDSKNTETMLTIFELEATTIEQTDQTVPK